MVLGWWAPDCDQDHSQEWSWSSEGTLFVGIRSAEVPRQPARWCFTCRWMRQRTTAWIWKRTSNMRAWSNTLPSIHVENKINLSRHWFASMPWLARHLRPKKSMSRPKEPKQQKPKLKQKIEWYQRPPQPNKLITGIPKPPNSHWQKWNHQCTYINILSLIGHIVQIDHKLDNKNH